MGAALATAGLSLNSLPVGFRFRPTDQELVVHYLWPKINGRDGAVGVINDIDVNEKEPWDWHEYSAIRTKDPEWFFFSQWHRKYSNGHRLDRATRAGNWKATGEDRKIKLGGTVIGMKKTLVFYERNPRVMHGTRGAPREKRPRWVMHEYRNTGFHPGQDEFVLCRLFNKSDETLTGSTSDAAEPVVALATAGLSLDSPPVGFRFRPTDQELVHHYLRLKINGRNGEVGVIREIDVYENEPWDLLPDLSAIQTRDPEWFFFSRRYRKYPNGDCFNRATTTGYWKPTGEVREIKLRGSVIGKKRTLIFCADQILRFICAPWGDTSRWVMHEYEITLEGLDDTHHGQDAFVLCRLFNKSGETPTGSTSVDENEEAWANTFDYGRCDDDCGET